MLFGVLGLCLNHCCHMGYSFRLASRDLLVAPSHRHYSTYHSLGYTSHGALAGTRNCSMGPPWRINPMTHHTMSKSSYHRATSRYHWLTGDTLKSSTIRLFKMYINGLKLCVISTVRSLISNNYSSLQSNNIYSNKPYLH